MVAGAACATCATYEVIISADDGCCSWIGAGTTRLLPKPPAVRADSPRRGDAWALEAAVVAAEDARRAEDSGPLALVAVVVDGGGARTNSSHERCGERAAASRRHSATRGHEGGGAPTTAPGDGRERPAAVREPASLGRGGSRPHSGGSR